MEQKVMLTIRASEGGIDSKNLSKDMADVYIRSAKINGFSMRKSELALWKHAMGIF